MTTAQPLVDVARSCTLTRWSGQVLSVSPTLLEVNGPAMSVGEQAVVRSRKSPGTLRAEAIALRPDRIVLMPLGTTDGIALGDPVSLVPDLCQLNVHEGWLGRVIDPYGNALDSQGPLPQGHRALTLKPAPLNPLERPAIERPLITGVRCIDAFLSLGQGQRVGIFAGSGVGKSTLLGMLARSAQADVNVVALVGERGREVQDFIAEQLGEAGLARSVVIVATSDQPAVARARAPLVATAVAEHFRDQGKQVFLMMDSVTRYAMARREIDLAAGIPPTARGYTPGVFADIPALCERAGVLRSAGSITGVYTVLVDGDDHNEPVADCLRATLDGHIVLSRDLAHEGHFPAIDVLHSVSRLASSLLTTDQSELVRHARQALSTHRRYREMIDMGLYQAGSNPELDEAQALVRRLQPFLQQAANESPAQVDLWRQLQQLVRVPVRHA